MMRQKRNLALLFAAAFSCLVLVGPAGALEDGLMGVRIGSSYREVLRRLGHSDGILFSAGGSIMYQTQPAATSGMPGLPSFSTQQPTGGAPVWVSPLQPASLADQQSEWVYDWRKTKGVALGVILSGEGADAVVTDVIVVGFPENLKGKPRPVTTEKGIGLQDTFAQVLSKYGYPPMIEIYAPSSAGGAAARQATGGRAGGGRTMRAGGARGGQGRGGGARAAGRGQRGGGRGGGGPMGGGGRRGGRMRGALDATTSAIAQGPRYELELTGGMMMGGGGRRGGGARGPGGRGGGGRGSRMGGGGGARARGAAGGRARVGLPPLGQAAPAGGKVLTATAVVNNQAITLSRDCILTYEGIAFTLHDMRVVRIHVSE